MSNLITSKKNENIKYASKLFNSAKFRLKNREFVIEGMKLCLDALKSGVKIQKIFYTEELYDKFSEQIDKIIEYSANYYVVDSKIMSVLSDMETPQGIVCVCAFCDSNCNSVLDEDVIVVLDNIQNPSNLGAIIRTCDALEVNKVIISSNSCDVYNPKVLRSSMGSVFRIAVSISENIVDVINLLNDNGFKTMAMAAEADSVDIRTLVPFRRVAMVIGNEGNGIRTEVKDACAYKAIIPIKSSVDSLNAAVAAGIAMWEVTRQRIENK